MVYTRKAALEEVGHLGIAFLGSSIHGTLSRVLAEYRRTHPEAEIEVTNVRFCPSCEELRKQVQPLISIYRMSPYP